MLSKDQLFYFPPNEILMMQVQRHYSFCWTVSHIQSWNILTFLDGAVSRIWWASRAKQKFTLLHDNAHRPDFNVTMSCIHWTKRLWFCSLQWVEKFTFKLFLAKQSLGFKIQTSIQIVRKYYVWSNRSISSSRHPFIGSLCPINLILLFDLDRKWVSQPMQWRSPPTARAPPAAPWACSAPWWRGCCRRWCSTAVLRTGRPALPSAWPSGSHQHRLSAQQNTA